MHRTSARVFASPESVPEGNSAPPPPRTGVSLTGQDNEKVGSQEPTIQEEEEFDEEREALIARFRRHLDGGGIVSSGASRELETTRHTTGEAPRQQSSIVDSRIKQELPSEQKSDQETSKTNTNHRARESVAAKHCVNNEATDDDAMKFDHRRDNAGAVDSGKNSVKHAMNYRKTYLFLYNLMMFIMFLMVHLILSIKGLAGKMDDASVQGAAFIIKLLTYTQLLESVHPLLGLVPGGPFMPFLQVIGRLLVNHFLTEPAIRQNSAPYAHLLFIVWASIEIFRYSFYALRVFNVEIYPITWARYTLFMPLYPMGGFCEAQIVMATVEHFERTGAYTLSLPNAANVSFCLPSFLRFYNVALLGPSIFYLMKYMWGQRCKQLKDKTD